MAGTGTGTEIETEIEIETETETETEIGTETEKDIRTGKETEIRTETEIETEMHDNGTGIPIYTSDCVVSLEGQHMVLCCSSHNALTDVAEWCVLFVDSLYCLPFLPSATHAHTFCPLFLVLYPDGYYLLLLSILFFASFIWPRLCVFLHKH